MLHFIVAVLTVSPVTSENRSVLPQFSELQNLMRKLLVFQPGDSAIRYQQVLRPSPFKTLGYFSFPESLWSSKDLSSNTWKILHIHICLNIYTYIVCQIIVTGHDYANPQPMQSHQGNISTSKKNYLGLCWGFKIIIIF